MAFMISVTKSGLSGLTNAYTSVKSAYGSPAIMGASRWLDAPARGVLRRVPANRPAVAARPPTRARGRFTADSFYASTEVLQLLKPTDACGQGASTNLGRVLNPRVRRVGTTGDHGRINGE